MGEARSNPRRTRPRPRKTAGRGRRGRRRSFARAPESAPPRSGGRRRRRAGRPQLGASVRVLEQQEDLIGGVFYGLNAAFFLAILLIKYRIEFILPFPARLVPVYWNQGESCRQDPRAVVPRMAVPDPGGRAAGRGGATVRHRHPDTWLGPAGGRVGAEGRGVRFRLALHHFYRTLPWAGGDPPRAGARSLLPGPLPGPRSVLGRASTWCSSIHRRPDLPQLVT